MTVAMVCTKVKKVKYKNLFLAKKFTSTSTTKWPPSFGWLFCHCIWCALAYSKSPKV